MAKALWYQIKYGNKPPPKKRYWIPRVSKRLKYPKQIYQREAQLWKFEHRFCEFCREIFDRAPRTTTEVHHRKKRGRFLLVKSTWAAACAECHDHIHDNETLAYEKGWLIRTKPNEPITE